MTWCCVALLGAGGCGGNSATKTDAASDSSKLDAGSGSSEPEEGSICTGNGQGNQDLCGGQDSSFQCISLPPSEHFWCAFECGTGPCAGSAASGSDANCTGTGIVGSGGPTPPADGDTMCQQQLEANGGTGAISCNLFAADPNGSGDQSVTWTCGILCGSNGSGNQLGSCPTGLDCTQNFCR